MVKNKEFLLHVRCLGVPIILLDEATFPDAESEEIVQNAIKNLIKNRTTVIAHRLSTIHNANKIFVLKMEKLKIMVSMNAPIKNCNEYKSLYEKQLK